MSSASRSLTGWNPDVGWAVGKIHFKIPQNCGQDAVCMGWSAGAEATPAPCCGIICTECCPRKCWLLLYSELLELLAAFQALCFTCGMDQGQLCHWDVKYVGALGAPCPQPETTRSLTLRAAYWLSPGVRHAPLPIPTPRLSLTFRFG